MSILHIARTRGLSVGRRLTATMVLAVVLTTVVVGRPASAAAAGLPDPCTPIVHICASDVLGGLGQAIPGLADAQKALNTIGGVVAAAGQSVLAAGIAWFTGSVVATSRDILGQPGAFVDTLTRPRLTAAAFLGRRGAYYVVASFGVVLLVGFIFLGVISGLLSGEPGQAMFRIVRDTPAAVLAILGFPWLVEQLIGAADGLCAAALPSGEVLRRLLDTQVFTPFDGIGVGLPQLLLAVVAFVAAVLVFVELLVRNVLVHLLVALAPLSFAGIVWPAARPAARKVAELTVAGVLAKPAIYVALKVGLDLIGEFTDSGVPGGAAWGSLLLGIAVVCLAAFAPYTVWRLLPHAEAFLAAQGVSRMPARAGMQVLQTAYWIDMLRSRPGGHRQTGPGRPAAPPPGTSPGPARRLPNPPAGGGSGGMAARMPASGSGGTGPAATGASGGAPAAGSAAPAAAAAGAAKAGQDRGAFASDRPTTRPTGAGAGSLGGSASGRASDGWVRRPRGGPGGAAGPAPGARR